MGKYPDRKPNSQCNSADASVTHVISNAHVRVGHHQAFIPKKRPSSKTAFFYGQNTWSTLTSVGLKRLTDNMNCIMLARFNRMSSANSRA